jgi:hypothetical protein
MATAAKGGGRETGHGGWTEERKIMQGRRWLAAGVCLLAMLAMTASASADRSVYPADRDAISLRNGPAGWSGDTSSEGLCVPVLLCPAITNSIRGHGGPGNAGYLHTRLGSLTGVGATSIATFTGPAFTYRGVGGKTPDDVALQLSRRADVAALLDVTGTDANYSVRLLNLSGGSDIELLGGEDLDGSRQWSEVPTVRVDPAQLQIGNRYRLEVVSRFESGVQVVTGTFADYAKVRLIAMQAKSAGDGSVPGDGAGPVGPADLAGGQIAGTVKVNGKHLSFRVRCAKRAPRKCRSHLQARLSKRGARVTGSKSVRIRPGARKRVRFAIRPRYRGKVADRKRIVIKRKTKVAGRKRTTYRTARVRG